MIKNVATTIEISEETYSDLQDLSFRELQGLKTELQKIDLAEIASHLDYSYNIRPIEIKLSQRQLRLSIPQFIDLEKKLSETLYYARLTSLLRNNLIDLA